MPPPIRFALTEDEVSIAYSVHGEGPPLVFVRGWISHLDQQWLFPDYRLFMEALGRHFTVVRYDVRGNGLSDRDCVGRLSLNDLVLDLFAVVDALKLGPATYFATCYGGPIVARFNTQAPHAIDRLILDGTYSRGEDIGTSEVRESLMSTLKLLQSQPGAAATMLRYYTDPTDTEPMVEGRKDRRVQFARDAINADAAQELYTLALSLDVTKDLLAVRVPTLVMHRRHSKSVPVELGRRVAALVPNATFVATEGKPHNPWDGDATAVLRALGDFLGLPLADGYFPRTSVRPTVILFSDIVDSTSMTSALGDSAAQEVVRAFHSISRDCLDARGGRLVKSLGDGVMADFPSVSQALGCAVDMQTAFAAFTSEHPDQNVSVRIGINAGEPVSEADDLHGLVVSTASRICADGGVGDILVSNVVRELAIGKGFTFVDRGAKELKGLGEPVYLYGVIY